MEKARPTISAVLVVYHEAAVLERCLRSLQGLADEIVIVHDGECHDESLTIAKRYTDKIFVREHAGMMEAHLVFAFTQASGDWLLRIDADEFFSAEDAPAIRALCANESIAGIVFPWEMWNGRQVITFPGLQKMCLMRRQQFHYCGIPHESGTVDGPIARSSVTLHHRPAYNNIAWRSFMQKSRKWVPVHARYYFPETIAIDCFACTVASWQAYTHRVRKHIILYLAFHPIKMALGQLKNGLWKSRYGLQVVCERYVYYVMLYWAIYRRMRLSQEYV